MKKIVGVDIGCTKMQLCVYENEQWYERRIATGLDVTREAIKKEIDSFIAQLPFVPDGIGIALPGLVEGDSRVKFSDLNDLNGMESDYFSDGMYTVRFLNDVRAATIAEVANHKEADTVAVIMNGTGLAMGVYANGDIIKGGSGFAGELGYSYFAVNGKEVQTADMLCGGQEILKKANCDAETFIQKIESGDPEALGIIESASFAFGLILTNVMHLYNPNVIVIGGSVIRYKNFLEHAKQVAETHTLKDIFDSCEIIVCKDLKRVVALGAIEYIRRIMQ